jgi:hypothetical protein
VRARAHTYTHSHTCTDLQQLALCALQLRAVRVVVPKGDNHATAAGVTQGDVPGVGGLTKSRSDAVRIMRDASSRGLLTHVGGRGTPIAGAVYAAAMRLLPGFQPAPPGQLAVVCLALDRPRLPHRQHHAQHVHRGLRLQ